MSHCVSIFGIMYLVMCSFLYKISFCCVKTVSSYLCNSAELRICFLWSHNVYIIKCFKCSKHFIYWKQAKTNHIFLKIWIGVNLSRELQTGEEIEALGAVVMYFDLGSGFTCVFNCAIHLYAFLHYISIKWNNIFHVLKHRRGLQMFPCLD